jgi:erythromycin esterase-like protein/CubicO group peptidase (beta-lactamase class C family)
VNIKVPHWLASAVAALLLVPILGACSNPPTAAPDDSAPTATVGGLVTQTVTPTSVSPSTPAPTAAVPAPTAAPSPPLPLDLSKVTPKPFDQRMRAELEAYITTLMRRQQVPGASVAVVQDGKVVYQQGFGVRQLGKPNPVTPATLMMIGSTGKSMTTMMMATVLDEGKMRWDTPAISILPTFAVSDSSLTPKITMRHLVCNCTGVQRRDIEMFFPSRPHTAEDMIQKLRTFSFAGTFGEAFQYSNQMVATGGYLAARAASPSPSNLYDDYVAQMQQRVVDPIGMTSTTFSFDKVRADPNRATPHSRRVDNSLVALPLTLEETLAPVAPAGGSWSNVQDLGRYLITQLKEGVAPDGRRVVSANNLKLTWQPQVQAAPNAWYALGWGVGTYKGAHLLNHGGGTSGFTSDLTFLPDANLGIAILSNVQNNTTFIGAVRSRVLELAYGLPMKADASYAQRTAQAQQAIRDQLAQFPPHLDLAAVAPYQGVYTNPELGEVMLALKDEKFVLDTGTFTTELRSAGKGTYLFWDSPLVGLQVKLTQDAARRLGLQLISEEADQSGTYTFTPAPPTAAVPGEVTAWIEEAAHPLNTLSPDQPLDDLAPLKEMVGDAELIGLGEATHGSSEFFSMKHRLVKYLVKEMGFTTVVLETDGPIGLALDEYILNGTGDPKAILDFPWRTQEVLALIEWLRLYNANPQHTHKVHFAGMDVQQITPEMFDSVTRLVAPNHPDLLREIEQQYQGLHAAPGTYETYFGIALETKTRYAAQAQQVVELLKQHQSALEQSTSTEEFSWALHNAQGISQFARMMELFESDPGQGYTYHEQAMAENAGWWHDQVGKTIIWAHNGHVANYTMLQQIYPDKIMGTFLRQRFGEQYVSLGFSFGQGQFNARTRTELGASREITTFTLGAPRPDSTNAVLQGVGLKRYLLDLRPAPEPVQAWLAEPRPFRLATLAVSPDPQEREAQSYTTGLAKDGKQTGSLRQWFDLIIHLDQITAAQRVKS